MFRGGSRLIRFLSRFFNRGAAAKTTVRARRATRFPMIDEERCDGRGHPAGQRQTVTDVRAIRASGSGTVGRPRLLAVLGVLFTLGVPCLPLGSWSDQFASERHLLANEAIWWVITASVLAWVVLVERRPLLSL